MTEALKGNENHVHHSDTATSISEETGQSFFGMLAEMLGDIAAELQKDMEEAGDKLVEMKEDGDDDSAMFTETQQEFQAAQQEFSMFLEVASTILKSIGQAAQTMARQN